MESVLHAVKNDLLHGFLMVDIEVPTEWRGDFKPRLSPREYYSRFPPLFSNTEIHFSDFGATMQKHVYEQQKAEHLAKGRSEESFKFREPNPRRLLISGLKGEGLLLATPLLRFYLKHGLVVTRVYQIIEYSMDRGFESFISWVENARRAADKDKDLEMFSQIAKNLGNSGYGSLLLKRERYSDVSYHRGDGEITMSIKNPRFRTLSDLGEQLYELQMAKKQIEISHPEHLGSFILNLAKLRLLEFVYDKLDVMTSRDRWQALQIDTDSFYFANCGVKTWTDIILPEFRREFELEVYGSCHDRITDFEQRFLTRKCCARHAAYDKRVVGLLNVEYESAGEYIGLCSKCYVCRGSDENVKFSSKGIQKKRLLSNTFERYQDVLRTGKSAGARNIGFKKRNGSIFTYEQLRKGLNAFYIKRIVQPDFIHTEPLEIVLNPWL